MWTIIELPPVYVYRNYLTVRVCKLDFGGDHNTLLVVPTVGNPLLVGATVAALYRYLALRLESRRTIPTFSTTRLCTARGVEQYPSCS
jgi:hypothetical protein